MREVLRKPAVHVVLLGLIVAAAILLAKGPPVTDASRQVVITGADLLQQRAAFMRTWQREPTAEELRGALEKHIRQEVLYREALARGYDRDDLVVRRAMQQKMEFLAASQAMQEPPTEEEIEAGVTVFGPVGCKQCNGGYKGRLGIFQVMEVSETMGRIIMEGGNAMQISDQAAKEGVVDLRQAGLNKVKEGVTSLDEVNRVTIE